MSRRTLRFHRRSTNKSPRARRERLLFACLFALLVLAATGSAYTIHTHAQIQGKNEALQKSTTNVNDEYTSTTEKEVGAEETTADQAALTVRQIRDDLDKVER